MKLLCTGLLIALFCTSLNAQDAVKKRIKSTVKTEDNGDISLTQEFTVNAPVKKVWQAFTTTEGWQGWVTPVANVDLKVGGVIKTNYRKDGKLTDDDAITLHIINYVPERLLTLQAELGPHFPDVLKKNEKQMYNVVTFEADGDNKTKVVSFGVGYRDTPELQKMLKFFVDANEQSYVSLLNYVEKGKK